ncbi:hypothetical protein, partial [Burkholderia cenocepacia]|uniref:hypothetical protein n=1 Tax=Burkholderia cenocepacia TaxID=95486 RepID=UPI002231AFCD
PVPVSSLITLASCADVVAANWFRPPDVSAMLPAHVKPAPDAQRNALFAPLQLGIANAIGAAVDAVGFATTVFAAIDDRPASDTVAHAGADDGPVDTTA